MTPLGLKKLITKFLLLSVAVSSFAIIFSNSRTVLSSQTKNTENTEANILSNSFAPIGSENTNPETNLTAELTNKVMSEVARLNPQGVADAEDASALTVPDDMTLDMIIDKVIVDHAADLKLKDFRTLTTPEAVSLLTNFTTEDSGRYLKTVRTVVEKTFSTPQYDLTNTLPDPLIASTHVKELETYVSDLQKAFVPAPLHDAHLALMTVLINQKELWNAASSYAEDPLRALLFLKVNEDATTNDFSNFNNEFKKIQFAPQSSYNQSNKFISLLQNTLGAPTAHAQFGALLSVPVNLAAVTDIDTINFYTAVAKNTALIYSQMVTEWKEKLVNEKLKEDVAKKLQDDTKEYIQNDAGEPLFVQDYESYYAKAAKQGGNEALGETLSVSCPSISPAIRTVYGNGVVPPTPTGITNLTRCPTQGINTRSFYSDFNNGGWDAYFKSFLPSGNLFGALAMTDQLTQSAAVQEEDAQQSEIEANNGYKSIETCPNGKQNSDGSCNQEVIQLPGDTVAQYPKTALVELPADRAVNADELSVGQKSPASILTQTLNGNKLSAKDITAGFRNIFKAIMDQIMDRVMARINDRVNAITADLQAFSLDGYLNKYNGLLRSRAGIMGL